MSTYTLKSIVRRGGLLAAAFALFAAAVIPAASTYADALNPLTDRSLSLSSSSPGWNFKDGSGNSTYAPPNSGANGQKAGNTFSFKVSTDTSNTAGTRIHAMTFQYCTTSAGNCIGPGDIVDHTQSNADNVANKKSDLEIVTSNQSELGSGDFSTYVDANKGTVKQVPAASTVGKNYVVYYQSAGVSTPGDTSDDVWSLSPDWVMSTAEKQDLNSTNKHNYITLVNTGTNAAGFAAGTPVKVVFFATDTNYITNPGSSWFFVKINTYSAVDANDPTDPQVNPLDVIDGGVTVANVMNQSIQITTKVLETMDFSVGTVDPNTLSAAQYTTAGAGSTRGTCDRILMTMDPSNTTAGVNTLKMGNQDGEFSLETAHTYSTHSYWRLSSNSSAGATVYYSGNTLSNTVGDKIDAIGATKAQPHVGSEQFGLAIANGDGSDLNAPSSVGYKVNYKTETKSGKVYEYGADDAAAGLVAYNAASPTGTGLDTAFLTAVSGNASYHTPQLYPLIPTANYGDGAGTVNADYDGSGSDPITTNFAFDEGSQTIPVAIATEDQQVVDCVTAKMRYVANIAATTPAGIYTTKVNYIAAPQY
ncbi:hypothetical protein J0I05_00130 [Candidatus Saccharibacteria bacterium]|nr:hypothetical protein [Candidatus Saccharibacteria bacterium]